MLYARLVFFASRLFFMIYVRLWRLKRYGCWRYDAVESHNLRHAVQRISPAAMPSTVPLTFHPPLGPR